jgi:hypothetical protein
MERVMTADFVFSIANMVALLSWVSLLVAAWRKSLWLSTEVLGRIVPIGFALVYSALILFFFASAPGGFDSLANVQLLFTAPWVALAGWVHYLAFDVFVGSWIVRNVLAAGLPRWPLLVILPLTFMFGPMGFLAFQIYRFLMSPAVEVVA